MKTNYSRVLDVFFDNPSGKFYIREIARISKLNPNTILNITKILEKEELIKRDKKKHIVELSANINEKFKKKKMIENINKIHDSGLIEFLVKEFSPEAISVIGSYSRGEDIKKSDIDIVIVKTKEKKSETSISLAYYERILGRKIHLINIDYDSISDEFYTNLINGIILYGFIKKK